MICIGRHVGGHAFALQHGGQKLLLAYILFNVSYLRSDVHFWHKLSYFYGIISHFFPIDSQHLMTWGVDSAEKVSSGLIVYPHPLYVG